MSASTETLPDTPAPQLPSTPPRATLEPRFMARVAGLPYRVVAGLRQPRSVAWAEQVLQAQEELLAEGSLLSDELHRLVESNADDQFRRTLINARRRIFAGNAPKDGQAVAARIGGEAGDRLHAWLARHERLRDLLGQPVVDTELAEARTHLRALATEPRLRQGLILASASLDTYLGSYLDTRGAALNKKQRRIERSLVEYVYRSACKTSPFSTFTGLALGGFRDDPTGSLELTVDPQWTDHTQLNIAVLGRLGELVLSGAHLRPDLPVSLVSGWTSDTDRIRYVRRTVATGDDSVAASFDAISETMFFLRHSGGLEVLLALFSERGELRYADLLDRFAARVDASARDCDRFLATLLRLGLLAVPALVVDMHSPDPVRAFADSVGGIDSAWSRRLRTDLLEVSGTVREYRGATLERRRALLAGVREQLGAIQRRLGTEDGGLPQTLIYEDSRAAAAPVTLDRETFERRIAAPLHSISRITPAFDMALPHRLTLRGFFLARYGRGGECTDLLGLVSDFQEDIYEHYVQVAGTRIPFAEDGSYVPADNWLDQPEITAVDRARMLFAERMRELAGSGGVDGADGTAGADLELDDEFVGEVAAELSPLAPEFRPESHFVQLCGSDATAEAVLNRSWGGVSFPFSRFTHGFADLGLAGELREWQRSVRPEGAVLAEITGGAARTNLNLHDRLTDYEVVCPGETSRAAPQAQLPLEDLTLRHDPVSDRLVLTSKRLGRQVIPVYLGYLVPVALPEVSRTLLLLSPSAMVTLDPWGGVPEGPAVDGVTTRPRVRHRGLVLSRRTWSAPVGSLPLAGQRTDGERFLAWQRWRRRHGLGAQVFFTLRLRPAEADPGSGARPVQRQKPHYLDFDSVLSLHLFEHLLNEEVAGVTFTEMLPSAGDLHTGSDAGRHVTELVVETVTGPTGTGAGEER